MQTDPKKIVSSLFEEFDKINAHKDEGQVPTSIFGVSHNSGNKAMDRLLKDASEIEKQTSSSRGGDFDFNEQELDGKARNKVEYYKPNIPPKKNEVLEMEQPVQPDEPLGYIENVDGVPRVVKDDKYLEPYTNDLYLR